MRHWISISRVAAAIAVAAIGASAGLLPAEAGPKKGVGRGRDKTAPTIVVPADITVEAKAPMGAAVAFVYSATDDFDLSPDVTCSHPSGSTFPVGTTTVTVTATDWRNNTSTETFDVTVTPADGPTHYTDQYVTWDLNGDYHPWYQWSITVAADGTVTGTLVQDWLLVITSDGWDEYLVPMPAGLTGGGTMTGTMAADGTCQLQVSGEIWYWWEGEYDGNGVPNYIDWLADFSGTTTATLNANGYISLSGGGYGAYWIED